MSLTNLLAQVANRSIDYVCRFSKDYDSLNYFFVRHGGMPVRMGVDTLIH